MLRTRNELHQGYPHHANQHDLRPCSTQFEALAKSVGRECLGFGNVGVCALFFVAPFGSSMNFCRFDSNVYSLRARGIKQHLSTSSDSLLRLCMCMSAFDIMLYESIIFHWRRTLLLPHVYDIQLYRTARSIRRKERGSAPHGIARQVPCYHSSPNQSATRNVAWEGRARWW